MNAETDRLLLGRRDELQDLGLEAQRRKALQSMKIKTVIKESHCTPVIALAFNGVDAECTNVFATVGSDQATIYDDLHMGDYIGVVVQYVNAESEHNKGGELRVCAWLNTESWSQHPQKDACLAVAGSDTNISVISVVEARVILQLRGHKKEVVDLASCSGRPALLGSLSKDGEMRLWDVPSEACLACVTTDASSLAMHPTGAYVLTGSRKGGVVCKWQMPSDASEAGVASKQRRRAKAAVVTDLEKEVAHCSSASKSLRQLRDRSTLSVLSLSSLLSAVRSYRKHRALPELLIFYECEQPYTVQELQKSAGGNSHMEAIDCMQFLSDERLASKSADGRVIITDLDNSEQVSSWKVPACHADAGSRCRFGTTPDGTTLCAGNSRGEIHVYNTTSGERLAHLAAIKVSGPVRACGISDDCRHLLATVGNGFIFRFEAVPEAVSQKEEEGPSEAAEAMEE